MRKEEAFFISPKFFLAYTTLMTCLWNGRISQINFNEFFRNSILPTYFFSHFIFYIYIYFHHINTSMHPDDVSKKKDKKIRSIHSKQPLPKKNLNQIKWQISLAVFFYFTTNHFFFYPFFFGRIIPSVKIYQRIKWNRKLDEFVVLGKF